MTTQQHIRIEVYDPDTNTTTLSEFTVIQDNIQIIEYYLELLDYQESYYAVFIDGKLDQHTTSNPPTQD